GGRARGTVVHCHGNAGNVSGHFEHVHWLPHEGWNLLCFDYRGYGRSDGRPRRRGTIDDAHAAIDYVRSRDDVDADRVVLFGQSIGGAIAIVAAAERDDVCGLATEGAFTTYREAARCALRQQWWTWGMSWIASRLLISKGSDPIDHVGRICPRPILIIQGTEDEIIDWRMGQQLYDAAGQPKQLWIVRGAGHTDVLELMLEVARARLLDFFEWCVRAGKAGRARP
ncbi:MAG: alpha/beta hydrolase, partial [Phycisphaerae bacterium]